MKDLLVAMFCSTMAFVSRATGIGHLPPTPLRDDVAFRRLCRARHEFAREALSTRRELLVLQRELRRTEARLRQ
jgi:hypothetical protein